jgi:hypothetical protein
MTKNRWVLLYFVALAFIVAAGLMFSGYMNVR